MASILSSRRLHAWLLTSALPGLTEYGVCPFLQAFTRMAINLRPSGAKTRLPAPPVECSLVLSTFPAQIQQSRAEFLRVTAFDSVELIQRRREIRRRRRARVDVYEPHHLQRRPEPQAFNKPRVGVDLMFGLAPVRHPADQVVISRRRLRQGKSAVVVGAGVIGMVVREKVGAHPKLAGVAGKLDDAVMVKDAVAPNHAEPSPHR